MRAAMEMGLLQPAHPAQDASFTMKLVMSVLHEYAFGISIEPVDETAERLWSFWLAAYGGARVSDL